MERKLNVKKLIISIVAIVLCIASITTLLLCFEKDKVMSVSDFGFNFGVNLTYTNVEETKVVTTSGVKYYKTCVVTVDIFPKVSGIFANSAVEYYLTSYDETWKFISPSEEEIRLLKFWWYRYTNHVFLDTNGCAKFSVVLYKETDDDSVNSIHPCEMIDATAKGLWGDVIIKKGIF